MLSDVEKGTNLMLMRLTPVAKLIDKNRMRRLSTQRVF